MYIKYTMCFELWASEILPTQNSQLVMLLAIQLKNKTGPNHVPIIYVNCFE